MNGRFAVSFAAILIVIVGGMGVHLVLKTRINSIADQIRMEEGRRPALKSAILRAQTRWSECTDPRSLNVALARHSLCMQTPRGEQIVNLRTTVRRDGMGGTTSFAYDNR